MYHNCLLRGWVLRQEELQIQGLPGLQSNYKGSLSTLVRPRLRRKSKPWLGPWLSVEGLASMWKTLGLIPGTTEK